MKNALVRFILGVFVMSPVVIILGVLYGMYARRPMTLPIGELVVYGAPAGVILYAVAVAYFLYSVNNNPRFDSADKARWTYIIVLWFPFGAIAYWWRYVALSDSASDRQTW